MSTYSKAIIFARVSSKSQEDEGYSLDSQLKLLRDYCEKKKLKVVKEFKITETASKAQRRKVFQELLAYVKRNKIYHFAVEKTDRATRNIKDAAHIYDWIEDDERRVLHCVKEGLELHKWSTSQVKFMWGIFVAFAKQYTDSLREEAMKGWDEKLAQGWLPAEPPVGYKTVTRDGKKIHVVNPEIYKFMPRVFRLALLPGYTRKRLSEEMALMGITTKNGRPFSASAVTRILTNPFYIGINRMRSKDYPGAQEPIIAKKLFYDVQLKLKSNQVPRQRKHNPIFKGMIICRNCGQKVYWSKQKGRFYGACQRRKVGCWNAKYLREDRTEVLIVQRLEEFDDPKGKILLKLKAALEITQPQDVGIYRQQMIDELSRKVKKLKRMEDNLYDDRLAGFISRQKYGEKRQHLAEQAVEVAERLAMLREAQEVAKPKPQHLSDNPIVNLYLKSSPNQKRIIMTSIFKRIETDGGNVIFE